MALDHPTAATPRGKPALLTGRNIILQFPYLPRHEYARGLAAGLLDATYPLDYEDYLRTAESALRSHARESRVVLVTLTIDDLLVFAARTGRNPARRSTRLACISGRRYGSPAPWPPERNARCWCGSRVKYKKCCGRPGFAEAAIPDRARFLLRVDATVPGVPRRVGVPSELSADKLHRALAEAIGRDGDQPRYRFEIEGRHVLDARIEDEDGAFRAIRNCVERFRGNVGAQRHGAAGSVKTRRSGCRSASCSVTCCTPSGPVT
jgi:hypothetical protein